MLRSALSIKPLTGTPTVSVTNPAPQSTRLDGSSSKTGPARGPEGLTIVILEPPPSPEPLTFTDIELSAKLMPEKVEMKLPPKKLTAVAPALRL